MSYSFTPGLSDPWRTSWAGDAWETRSSLGVSLSLPLDPGGRAFARLKVTP